jgi:hypothetical protein
MERNPQQALEELIHRELAKLPNRPAPETLIPRVLAEIQARAHRRWWQRPWPQWPLALQLASVPVLLAGFIGTLYGLSVTWKFFTGEMQFGTVWDTLGSFSVVLDVLDTLASAVVVLCRYVGPLWVAGVLMVPVVMYLACVGLGTLCYRMAVYKRPA